MRVDVKSIVGDSALTLEDGLKLYALIMPSLHNNECVRLDFSGLTLFASLFFNAAIGQLLRDFDPNALNKLLVVENLDPTGSETLRSSIENAKVFYSSEDFRKAQSEVLRAMAEAD